jgi:phosphoribosylamine--glycine ligase
MRVLVLGQDGRAHTLIWKLFNSPLITELLCAPGNGGSSQLAPSAETGAGADAIARWAFDEGIDLIIPADSSALHEGLVDEVVSLHIGVSGPSQRSALLERSRCQTKEFLLRHGLPSPPGRPFDDLATAEKFLASHSLPVIIKADHPDGGEAVYHERYAALAGLRDLFAARPMEAHRGGVVIESFLEGPRVVFSAFTDGTTALPLQPARLYDHIAAEGGPQARGIGAHTASTRYAQMLGDYLHQKLIAPILAGLARDSMPYWGLLGIDTIITRDGPRLTAIRSSFREGEAQVVLPRLEDDLLPIAQAMIARRLHEVAPLRWTPTASVGIGLYARGYPHHYPTGGPIQGIELLDEGVLLFHSATESTGGLRYIPRSLSGGMSLGRGNALGSALPRVSGGLVATIVCQAATLAGARGRALVNAERITFDGRSYREDIGAKEFA